MGKTKDLLKKITDTKGTFHAKMGTIKDRKNSEVGEDNSSRKMVSDVGERSGDKLS